MAERRNTALDLCPQTDAQALHLISIMDF